jgi:imidazolonepropionase
MPAATLLFNIGDLVSLAPLARSQSFAQVKAADLGRLAHSWLFIVKGKVKAFGSMPYPQEFASSGVQLVDAKGALVLPGLVDSHTHLLFAGTRSNEFAARLAGSSYQEIAAAGGGIQATVQATRNTSAEELLHLAHKRLKMLRAWGSTSVEVKSGYGLSVHEELRHLEILQTLKQESAQALHITCLALHAVGAGYGSAAAYADAMCKELLPEVHKRQLADGVDAFIEAGYFSIADCAAFMRSAQSYGLQIRVHADEFTNSQGAAAAAAWGAKSADHLQHADEAGLQAMAEKQVVATILPGTSLYTGIPFVAAPKLYAAGCAVAIASDYNPGSCYLGNLPLLASIAGVHCKMSPAQIIAGVTIVPAYSLGLSQSKGALAVGYDADLLLHDAGSVEGWLADMGQTPPREVWTW